MELQDDVELDAEISSVQELALIRIKLNYEGLNGPGDIGPDYSSPECRIKAQHIICISTLFPYVPQNT